MIGPLFLTNFREEMEFENSATLKIFFNLYYRINPKHEKVIKT